MVETPTLLEVIPVYMENLSLPSNWFKALNRYIPFALPVVPIPTVFDFNFKLVDCVFSKLNIKLFEDILDVIIPNLFNETLLASLLKYASLKKYLHPYEIHNFLLNSFLG